MYIVKVKSLTLLFNKTFNLSYGMFLNDTKDIKCLAFKEPSSMKAVNYKSMIDELYKTKISDDKDEDIYQTNN